MTGIGKINSLEIARRTEQGFYLIDENGNAVLLPNRYITADMNIGDTIDVFVYNDSEDRPIATTETPYAQVGEFALLSVKAVNSIGAFLDWGLMKDLLVPFREQRMRMIAGRSYIVYVYVDDESKRIVCSANAFWSVGIPLETTDTIVSARNVVAVEAHMLRIFDIRARRRIESRRV